MCVDLKIFLVLVLFFHIKIALGGTCWTAMVRNGRCTEILKEQSTKEECCGSNSFGINTAYSGDQLDSGALFFWRVLGGGVPCQPCKDSCKDMFCGKNKKCVIKKGQPKCICAMKCMENEKESNRKILKSPVCGTDGVTYKNQCRLKKRACRKNDTNLHVAYYGSCQNSCDKIKCQSGKQCLLDQNARPHCVKCLRHCAKYSPSRRKVCGADGVTYPNICQLRQKSCKLGYAVPLAYRGICQPNPTCKKIKCHDGLTCLNSIDDNIKQPRCVSCGGTCKKMNKSLVKEIVCGSNNATYPSWCHLIQDSCMKGYLIETKHQGNCLTNIKKD